MDTDKAGWLARTKALGGRIILVTDRCHSAALAAPGLLLRIRLPAPSPAAWSASENSPAISTELFRLNAPGAGLGQPVILPS